MSQPFFVDHNGVPLHTYKDSPTPSQVETLAEPTIDELAAKEAERQSTKKHQ